MTRPRILVVDDDGPILLLMRSLLREFGFEPVLASSGEEAIAAARAHPPALMLLDRNMPGMPGDRVVITAGVPAGITGHTNMVQVRTA